MPQTLGFLELKNVIHHFSTIHDIAEFFQVNKKTQKTVISLRRSPHFDLAYDEHEKRQKIYQQLRLIPSLQTIEITNDFELIEMIPQDILLDVSTLNLETHEIVQKYKNRIVSLSVIPDALFDFSLCENMKRLTISYTFEQTSSNSKSQSSGSSEPPKESEELSIVNSFWSNKSKHLDFFRLQFINGVDEYFLETIQTYSFDSVVVVVDPPFFSTTKSKSKNCPHVTVCSTTLTQQCEDIVLLFDDNTLHVTLPLTPQQKEELNKYFPTSIVSTDEDNSLTFSSFQSLI